MKNKAVAILLAGAMTVVTACSGTESSPASESADTTESSETTEEATEESSEAEETEEETAEEAEVSEDAETESDDTSTVETTSEEQRAYIEETLNLANNKDYTWSYDADADAWVMSIVSTVAYPELEDEQGVSVCVPGAYVTGIDTDGDGEADVTAKSYTEEVNGNLVIDYEAEITSTNGQKYTASTAPVIINTGGAGYSSSNNSMASTEHAADGYINIACGNRGKQDTAEDEEGNTYYTGDAPLCLVDQKNAARFVRYNILLGNLPGSTQYWVSTGGSGGGAHATMFAVTSNSSDFYDYSIECGAVGVYKNEDGTYTTSVSIDGEEAEVTDGAWGTVAYSPITSLYESDMTLAFEYYMDTTYEFNTTFQKQLAQYLSEEYMEYINAQNLTVEESAVGFDLNGDGDTDDTIDLSIEYDEEKYADTNGYGGTYLDLYLAEFTENLQWYLDNLDYAEDWTWFNEDGSAMSDEEVAAMTSEDRVAAFIAGRYAKSSAGGMGGPGMGGGAPDGAGPGGDMGEMPEGMDGAGPGGDMGDAAGPGESSDEESAENADETEAAGDMTESPEGGEAAGDMAEAPEDAEAEEETEDSEETSVADANTANQLEVGTPDAGTTQSAGSSTDSSNYSTFEEMLEAYESDIEEVYAGDKYGNNQVELYNPLNYINEDTDSSLTWVRLVSGASEGDISMFNSLNIQLALLANDIDATIEWQWDGGHVPSEILGESLALYVDEMYAKYVDGAVTDIEKAEAETQTANGDSEEASGTDLSSWVTYEDGKVSFSLADALAYRTKGASKAMPAFDVIDYGQEDYVFGNSEVDARHWDKILLEVMKEHADELSELFNQG